MKEDSKISGTAIAIAAAILFASVPVTVPASEKADVAFSNGGVVETCKPRC